MFHLYEPLLFVVSGLENLITTAVAEIKDDLKEILARVNQLTSNNQITVASKLPISIPITTKDSLDDVENWLQNETNVVTLVSSLFICGYISTKRKS